MDQVFISDLSARGILGINDWEREKPQEILVNLVLFGDLSRAGVSDDIRDCINYRTVAKKVLAQAETARRYTVEALAADLARLCLDEPGVQKVRVRVEKPGAVRFSRSVGVEIEREKGAAE
jgi:FolB domain-containing protein